MAGRGQPDSWAEGTMCGCGNEGISRGYGRGFLPISLLPHQGIPLPFAYDPVLLLPEVGHEDEGIYSCVATHPSHEPQESPPVSISIAGNPSPDPRDPGAR